MTPISNQEVYDALTHCIEERWAELAKGARLADVPNCALCKLFGGYIGSRDCEACPVYLHNGGLGCGEGSRYDKWRFAAASRVKNAATKMHDSLKDAKKHFFGDWE